MKRLGNLYDSMISYSNANYVLNRIISNSKNKKYIYDFLKNKNCNIIDILNRLRCCNYEFNNYNIFLIHEKKYRIIMSESIRDKLVNQMVSYYILKPAFKNIIDSNVATRENMGNKRAYHLLEDYVRKIGTNKKIYVLRIDIKKYFYNINHNILYKMLEKRIKDKKALMIINNIISLTDRSYVNKRIDYLVNKEIKRVNKLNISRSNKDNLINELLSIPRYKYGKGLSIGCLSNQLLAVFYLDYIDKYIKEVLCYKYYIRYMDDLFIIDTDKDKLIKSFDLIKNKINILNLDINIKSNIFILNNGINFLGYNYLINNKLLIRYDNRVIRRINKKLKNLYNNDYNKFFSSILSYKGYFIRCNSSLYYRKYKYYIINNLYDKYKLLNMKYNNYIIFIKYKNKYYSYNDMLRYRVYKVINNIKGNIIILHGNNITFYMGSK